MKFRTVFIVAGLAIVGLIIVGRNPENSNSALAERGIGHDFESMFYDTLSPELLAQATKLNIHEPQTIKNVVSSGRATTINIYCTNAEISNGYTKRIARFLPQNNPTKERNKIKLEYSQKVLQVCDNIQKTT